MTFFFGFDSLIMQAIATNDPISEGAHFIQTVVITVSTVSGLGAAIFVKIKGSMKNSERAAVQKAGNFIESYVVPVLEEGAKVAEKTKVQEEKLKQFGDVLYEFMGSKANKISGKEEIKQINLLHDVTVADGDTKEYHDKILRLQIMAKELGILQSVPPTPTIVVPTPPVPVAKPKPKPKPAVPVEEEEEEVVVEPEPSIVWDEATKAWISK